MVQIIKDILGIAVYDFDFLFVLFCCLWLTVGIFYIFAVMTIPINIITNTFERITKK